MDQTYLLLAMIALAVIGILAVLHISRRDRSEAHVTTDESPFAVSTEGMKRCPNCGTGNLVTDSTCSNCGKRLPG
jgi:zinc-ribbon domain